MTIEFFVVLVFVYTCAIVAVSAITSGVTMFKDGGCTCVIAAITTGITMFKGVGCIFHCTCAVAAIETGAIILKAIATEVTRFRR